MEQKKINPLEVLIIGLAFFATYFGAGNLIFPPMLGLQSGTNWLSGMLGMFISGIGLPILSIIVLGRLGSVSAITDHIHKKVYTLYCGLIMIFCCCVSIPRTAAVGVEMGLQGVWPEAPYVISVIVYFVLAFFFAKDKGKALDMVGKFLTPIMTIILFILVVIGITNPIGTPADPEVEGAFINSFLGGYNTGDVLVSFLMASVFISTITNHGYQGDQMKKVNVIAGIIAAICLCVIYGGLLFMGACVSSEYSSDSISNADLLLTIIRRSGGSVAIYGMCLSVVLACLTTAIGQITAVADFFETETNHKLSYIIWVIIACVVTTGVATLGLDTIVSITSPLFNFMYSLTLTFLVLGICSKWIPNDGGYKGAFILVLIYALLNLPSDYGVHITVIESVLNLIPLHSLGFGWIVPAIVGFIIGIAVYKKKEA